MSDGAATESGTTLEQQLEQMLEIERFAAAGVVPRATRC